MSQSQPSTRTLRFQDEEAGIQHQSTPRSNATYLTVSTPNSPAPQAQPLLSPSASRSTSRSARSPHLSSHPSNASSANNGRLRPRPSILKQRLRSLQYNDDEERAQQIDPSIPPVPRRRGSNYSQSMSLLRGNSTSQPNNTGDKDTAGLLDYVPETGASTSWPEPGRRQHGHTGDTIEMHSVPLSLSLSEIKRHDYKDKAEYEEVKLDDKSSSASPHHHHRRLDELIHGDRPDRHLFPYRTTPENLHAAKTFFRRFFLILLIIPGWVIPNVLSKVNEETETEGTEHAENLSKGLNVLVFLLNLLAMMHLGKAAGACLEELVPKLGAVSYTQCVLSYLFVYFWWEFFFFFLPLLTHNAHWSRFVIC